MFPSPEHKDEAIYAASHSLHCPVSVHVFEPDHVRANAAGCDSYLAKPYSPTRLLGEITRVLDEQG